MTDELYHHGVLGMKWGVRRYQNPDGTLTNQGRKRYLKDIKNTGKLSSKEYKTVKSYTKAKVLADKTKKYNSQFKDNNTYVLAANTYKFNKELNKKANVYNKKASELTKSEKKNISSVIKDVGSIKVNNLDDKVLTSGKNFYRTFNTSMTVAGVMGGIPAYLLTDLAFNTAGNIMKVR